MLRNPKKTPVTFLVKWIMLYKQDKEGFYVISPANETIYMITNCPNYSYARKTETKIFILDFYFIHQSWARSESEIEDKIKNWGHKNDFDTNTFFENWKNLNKNNYRDFKNFHPLNKETWQELEFIEAKNLEDFIQICKKNKPQGVLEMKMKLSKKIKLYIKSLF